MKNSYNSIDNKSQAQIAREWDALASTRFNQISSGKDLLFRKIIVPNIIKLLPREKKGNLIDVGCGTGYLTSEFSSIYSEVVGIDLSKKSIELAIGAYGQKCQFLARSAEDFSDHARQKYSVVCANMVLMDIMKLNNFLKAVVKIMADNGVFLFSMTHPCFWPCYCGYNNEDWFDYNKEIIIEGPFRISTERGNTLVSTHMHRSWEKYINAFSKVGLRIEILQEPMPSIEIQKLYPAMWRYPRYVFGRCVSA